MDHAPSSSTTDERESTDLAALAAEVAALRDRLTATEAELAALRSPDATPTSTNLPEDPHRVESPVGRRHLIKAGLAAAAGAAGAVLVDGQPAAAANGDGLILGQYNTASTGTRLNITSDGFANGINILDHDNTNFLNAGIAVSARSQAFEIGISVNSLYGSAINATSGTGTGVRASANSGTGLHVASTSGPGADISSKQYQLRLNLPGATRPAPTADAIQHRIGEIVRDEDGDLWLCTVTGTPGTWRKLGGPATAGAFHLLPTPIRVYDSRPATTPSVGSKTPLVPNANRTLDLTANSSGVPADALGVVCNVLLVNAATGGGNFTIWANGVAKPQSNTMVWGGSAGRFSTLALTKVDGAGRAQVNASLSTDLVLDIAGYYR